MTIRRGMRKGFTLIEILVVLVIMGFLVALVAPKLSGIVDSAVDTNCDTNQERLRKVVNTVVQQTNALPSGLTNMVLINDADTTALIPSVGDGDKSNGAEVLSADFDERYHPQVHFLDAAEAEEIIALGEKEVYALQKTAAAADVSDVNPVIEQNVKQTVAAGIPVMMAGVGINAAGDTATWAEGNTITLAGSAVTEDTATPLALTAGTAADAESDGTFARMDEGLAIGRILMGVANNSELVTSGMVDESGTCPGQLQNEDQFSWGNYVILLPRLGATAERLTSVTTGALADGELHALALDVDTGDSATGAMIVGRIDTELAGQELKDFTTSCPEGHTWGAAADSHAVKVN